MGNRVVHNIRAANILGAIQVMWQRPANHSAWSWSLLSAGRGLVAMWMVTVPTGSLEITRANSVTRSLSLSLLCPNLPVALRSGQRSVVMLTFPNRLKKENVYCHLYSETLLSAVDSQIKEKLECKHLHHHKKYIIIITVITHYVNLEIFQKARSVQTFWFCETWLKIVFVQHFIMQTLI